MKQFMKYCMMTIVMVFVPMILASCGDDEDEPIDGTGNLVGTWIHTDSDGDTYTLQFNSNGTGSIGLTFSDKQSVTHSFNYVYDRNEKVCEIYDCMSPVLEEGKYKVVFFSKTSINFGTLTFHRKGS